MSDPTQRIEELLVERIERALSAGEATELAQLLEQSPDWHVDDFELAAGAVAATQAAPDESMPAHLLERLSAAGVRDVLGADVREQPPSTPASTPGAPPAANSAWYVAVLGWVVAAAAAIGFAVYALGPNAAPSDTADVADVEPSCPECPSPEPQPEPPTPAEQREQLVADSGVQPRAWTRTEDELAGEVAGDVVWDPESQRGYMTFRGLPVNDPEVRQYQLWIFDGQRSAEQPVDGGVFDISEDGEVVIPIDAKIAVKEAQMFAITVEPPGGVVVSKREHIVALAKLEE